MLSKSSVVVVERIEAYNTNKIENLLPDNLFSAIKPGDSIVLKPNWVRQSHEFRENDWEYIITHPAVISAVIRKVVKRLQNKGTILIVDSPETPSIFSDILSRNPISEWESLCKTSGINFQIIDLRDDEWIVEGNIIKQRKKLPGDPMGNTEIDLSQNSEFFMHKKSKMGYYGADYNIKETNYSHDGIKNIYRISKSVLAADVFINLPKLKTHKKSGITCCLKNLVGVNTYKNYLPHYSIGSPSEGGDQFPNSSSKNRFESKLLYITKQYFLTNQFIARIISPFFRPGKALFGESRTIIRSGNWFGNDTLWRMILDLNKIVYYSRSNGTLKDEDLSNRKNFITIVDAILCGEKNGPKSPEPKLLGCLIYGTDPVSVDATAARLMGFNPLKIPVIAKAFQMKRYKIVDFDYNDILVKIDSKSYTLNSIPKEFIKVFEPHMGWRNLLE